MGILKLDRNVERDVPVTTSNLHLLGVADSVIFSRGNKLFELTNHLGNVLVTISDKRYGVRTTTDTTAGYFIPDVVGANDYYPFGSMQPGRSYAQSGNGYRYGFNGKENDNEVKGEGNEIDYGMRVYDPRIGRFLSVDPKTINFPRLTPFQYASNIPVQAIDLDGLEGTKYDVAYRENGKEKMKKVVDVDVYVGISKIRADQFQQADIPVIKQAFESEYNRGFVVDGEKVEFNFNVQTFNIDASNLDDFARNLQRTSSKETADVNFIDNNTNSQFIKGV